MAVFVDISNTSHLTYSPLNEKHNILYHRARHNVNERHVQKPWFDLNPFLDKEDDKGLKLDDYRPEYDTGIQPLESLSVIEDYFSEKPLMAKEFKIGEFWEFLFSEDWGEGYSIRVLEGRLYNLIMSILVNLSQSGTVVQHSTIAYAKNRRQKYSIYKHSDKEPELGLHEETLLLEFIYYGHSTKKPLDTDDSSYGYPKMTTCSTGTSRTCHAGVMMTSLSSEIESETDSLRFMESAISRNEHMTTSTSSTGDQLANQRSRLMNKRNRLTSSSSSQSKPPIDRSLSRVQETTPRFRGRPGIRRNQAVSNFSSCSEDYRRPYDYDVDLTKFACTEKISYLGEFDLSDDSSCSSGDEDETTDYGQQMYLGDRSDRKKPEEILTVEEKLRMRKASYKNTALKMKELKSNVYQPKPLFPEFSELDVNKYLAEDEDQKNNMEDLPDEVPDLIEFIDILKRDERLEQLNSRKKPKTKNADKKSRVIKPANERFAEEVGGVTDSQACRLHCYQKDPSWKIMSEYARKKFLKDKTFQGAGKAKEKGKRKQKQSQSKKEMQIPYIYITTPSGITYLHPISRLMVKKKLKKKTKAKGESPTRRRLSLVPPGTPLGQEMAKTRRQSMARSGSPAECMKRDEKVDKDVRKFPKAKSIVSGIESPDFDSDEESDGLEESLFNSTKLNVRYSLERIKRKKLQKKRESPAHKNMYTILKKYYRMQSILKAFSGPQPRRRSGSRGSISSLLPKQSGGPMRRRTKKLPTIVDEKAATNVTVGKLKWFPFLDAKRKLMPPCDELDEPLFENYPMDKFRENLARALDEFVVRREVVISDYSAKASVSITFTKKYVFSKVK